MPSTCIILSLLLLLVSSSMTGEARNLTDQVGFNLKTWCVAKSSASEDQLNKNIQFACNSAVGDRCQVVQFGGACYLPATAINHASVLMNIYYQSNQRQDYTCFFNNSGLITFTDPSYGSCHYD